MLLVITPKSVYASQRLKQECVKASVRAHFFDVQELAQKGFDIDIQKYSCLYIRQAWPYFSEMVDLSKGFMKAGKRVVDQNMADGDIDVSKLYMYEMLKKNNIQIPGTYSLSDVIPEATSGSEGYPESIQRSRIGVRDDMVNYPYIVKWVYGFGGKQVYLVRDAEDLKKILALHPQEELIAQDVVDAKYEYKIITVGFSAIASVLRFEINPKTLRPDFEKCTVLLADSETVKNVSQLAENAARVLGRELSKVDILEDKHGKQFVLEVNRQPGFQNFEKLSRYNVAKDFIAYLNKKKTGQTL